MSSAALKLAAIGGPLTLSAKPYPGNPTTFSHDQGDDTKPVYTQYFDYGHASPPTNSGNQRTQDATAAVALAQPTGTKPTNGTKMKWTYGSFYCPELAANSTANLSSITLQAESAAPSPTTVYCSFHYVDPTDPGLVGDADDDTATTPRSTGSTFMLVNKVSAHRPQTLPIDYTTTAQNVDPNLPDFYATSPLSGSTYALTDYTFQLKDHLGDGMPGVWVQERFSSAPPGITVNTDADYWTTIMPSLGSSAGDFDAPDRISFSWPPIVATFSADHTFFGATQYVDWIHTPTGISVATYTATWKCSLYPFQVIKP